MNNRILAPFLAIQFLTRVPLRFLDNVPSDDVVAELPKAPVWFGVVGGLIGVFTAIVYLVLANFFPAPIAILLALGFEILLTGAFHEDAFADFCDGFGGGNTPERVHEIMKDSRIGTYGAAGLGLALATRFTAMLYIPPQHLCAAIIFSEALSRVTPLILMKIVPQVEFSVKISKDIAADTGLYEIIKATILCLPFWVVGAWILGFKIVLLAILTAGFIYWLSGFLMRKLGGRNGDCLGFAVYVVKLLCLLLFVIK